MEREPTVISGLLPPRSPGLVDTMSLDKRPAWVGPDRIVVTQHPPKPAAAVPLRHYDPERSRTYGGAHFGFYCPKNVPGVDLG